MSEQVLLSGTAPSSGMMMSDMNCTFCSGKTFARPEDIFIGSCQMHKGWDQKILRGELKGDKMCTFCSNKSWSRPEEIMLGNCMIH